MAQNNGYFSDFKKGEVDELKALLRNVSVQRDSKKKLEVLKKIIAYMTLGIDVSRLCGEVVMASASNNLVQKKLCYLYLCNYAETNADIALLSINTFQKDCKDENPMIRGLALRNMSSLRVPHLVEYLVDPLQAGLADHAAYVRKTAVMGCLKLYHMVPSMVKDSGLVDKLYEMIQDRDPQVIANCIIALNEILADEGGMALNKTIAIHLFAKLREFNEWSQCMVLDTLGRYTPETQEEVFDIMNILDERLKHSSSAVVVSSISIFLKITSSMLEVHKQVYDRIKTPILTLMRSGRPEIAFSILHHIQLLVDRQPEVFGSEFKHFFCRFNDPSYIKSLKLSILTSICNELNMHDIINELSEYVTDVDVELAKSSIHALANICSKLPAATIHVISSLRVFLELDIEYVLSESIILMKKLLHKYPDNAKELIPMLKNTYSALDDPSAKAAMIWMLGEYGNEVDEAPYMLETFVDIYAEEESAEVKIALLTSVVKLFFKRPPEVQGMLGRLFAEATQDVSNSDVHDRALFFYRLLTTDVNEAARVIGAHKNMVSVYAEDEAEDLKDKIFEEFNTLSVIYGQPSEMFIKNTGPSPLLEIHARAGAEAEDVAEAGVGGGGVGGGDVGDVGDVYQAGPTPDPNFPLETTPSLAADDFQSKWMTLAEGSSIEATVSPIPQIGQLESTFTRYSIATMASGQVDSQMKLYIYAHQLAPDSYHLAELIIDVTNGAFQATIKSDIPEAATRFAQYLGEALGSLAN